MAKKPKKRVVAALARNYGIDADEFILALWDFDKKRGTFDYVADGKSVVRSSDLKDIRRAIRSYKNKKANPAQDIKTEEPVRLVFKDFDFSFLGRPHGSISYITPEEIKRIHAELTLDFSDLDDPITPPGIKDNGLLESAVYHPQTQYRGNKKYPTVETAAAALMYALSHNHAFHNGNKRVSVVALLVFLDKHNFRLTCDENELFRTSLRLADHKLVPEQYRYNDAEIFELAKWVHAHSRVLKRGEHPISVKRLKQILELFNCEIQENGRVRRAIPAQGWLLWKKQPRVLISKGIVSPNIPGGDEIDMNLVRVLRRDLELTPEFGIDSDVFYRQSEQSSGEFILRYHNLLRRLSKL